MKIKIIKATAKYSKKISSLGKKTKELQIDDSKNQYYSAISVERAIKNKDNIFLIALADNKFAGFILANYHSYFRELYLSDLVVDEKFRGNDIATNLFSALKKESNKKDIGWSWGLVQEENTRMQKILEKYGFIKGKKFYFYYKNS